MIVRFLPSKISENIGCEKISLFSPLLTTVGVLSSLPMSSLMLSTCILPLIGNVVTFGTGVKDDRDERNTAS